MLKFNPDKTNCTGCSACYSACPIHCISLIPDEEGFLYPKASDACIDCKLCEKVCPLINGKNDIDYPKTVYAAVSKEYKIWHRSTSGGAFSEIVRHWADDDTLIVGAAWTGFTVHHVGIIGFKNIAPLCKSKYISSAIEDTFIEIRKHLHTNKKVIFCGCPCQVDGLHHFLRKDSDKLLTIDLICHGQGSPIVFKKCVDVMDKYFGEQITSYEFRSKRKIVETDYLSKITTKNKTYYVVNDPYQQLFLSQDILRPSCGKNCKYRDIQRTGDLTIADCKGLCEIFPDLKGSKKNYSTIVINTKKGSESIRNLSTTMDLRKYAVEDVVKYNPLFAHHTWHSTSRDQFFIDFENDSQKAISARTKTFSVKKIGAKTLVKTILPEWILILIYKII